MKANVEQELGDKLNRDHWKIFGLLGLYTHPHNSSSLVKTCCN